MSRSSESQSKEARLWELRRAQVWRPEVRWKLILHTNKRFFCRPWIRLYHSAQEQHSGTNATPHSQTQTSTSWLCIPADGHRGLVRISV